MTGTMPEQEDQNREDQDKDQDKDQGEHKELLANLPSEISYEESKSLAKTSDAKLRRALAVHPDTKPEVLYFLAEDDDVAVRQAIAENDRTPRQADLLLTKDSEEQVRAALAEKVARLTPTLSSGEKNTVYDATVAVLENLARDQVTRVRALLADALKDVAEAPQGVILDLARDSEIMVSAPVLQFSPVLTDDDLLSIVRSGAVQDAIAAISKRKNVTAGVADAVVEHGDEKAITILLSNDSAQIREETLDALVERAPKISAWHEPLVTRPVLPMRAAAKLAGFVADTLLDRLRNRKDLPQEVVDAVADAVSERLARDAPEAEDPDWAADDVSDEEIDRLYDKGKLSADAILDAIEEGRKRFAEMALAKRSGLDRTTVTRAVAQKSAKGLLSLGWKAGFTPEEAVAIQIRLAGIPPDDAIGADEDGAWPLSEDDMEWQLEFFSEP